jgi:hypothetical protein
VASRPLPKSGDKAQASAVDRCEAISAGDISCDVAPAD